MGDLKEQKRAKKAAKSEKVARKQKHTRNKKHLKSISATIQYSIKMLLGIAIGIMVLVAVISNLTITQQILRNDMQITARITADRVSQELAVTKAIVSEMGTIANLSSPSYTASQKQEMITQRVETYGMVRGKLINKDGICEFDGTDYSDRDYFQRSMQGEEVVSDPIFAKTDGKLSVIISAPVYAAGKPSNPVAGVVFLVPQTDFMDEIMQDIKISNNASAYMLSSEGITVAHSTEGIAETQLNTIEQSKTDSSLKSLAKIQEKMIAGEMGYDTYFQNGTTKLIAYAPVEGTNGWSIAIEAPITDFMSTTIISTIIAVVIAILAVLLGTKTAKLIGKTIGDPIKLCADRLVLLSQGDLHSPMPEITSEDETRILADATGSLANSLKLVIEDADYLLSEMSEGNFAVDTEKEDAYVGDFRGLITSMRTLNIRLDETLKNITEAVEQVTMGATQMAETAQGLAEGATDQAGAVQELQATITNVTSIVTDSAKSLEASYKTAKEYQQQAIASGEEMKELTGAMERINATSRQINDIIEEIEDIASQTNLLSLNAAIEAARAGEAGRGFAVVADQIRKLADDSAQSAVHTRELIETSLQEIEHGNEITDRTYSSLMKVVEGMEVLAGESQQAMNNSAAQAEAMEQIEQGIDQISAVVENNSATAEETSATSEELSAQAANMNELVAAFTLRSEA